MASMACGWDSSAGHDGSSLFPYGGLPRLVPVQLEHLHACGYACWGGGGLVIEHRCRVLVRQYDMGKG